jgi:hypothetical protein
VLDKLDYYDILGVVIPGILLTYWLPICFPQTVEMAAVAGFPTAIDVIGFGAIAVFFGQVIQAIASTLEGLLYWSWGGMPSERALQKGLGKRYLSQETGKRIRERLNMLAQPDHSSQDLFLIAMTNANAAPGSRSERFNALYAYNRALIFVVTIALMLLITSRLWGAAEDWSSTRFWVLLAVLVAILALFWYRTKQRAYYFVREVLLMAEKSLDLQSSNPSAVLQKG